MSYEFLTTVLTGAIVRGRSGQGDFRVLSHSACKLYVETLDSLSRYTRFGCELARNGH